MVCPLLVRLERSAREHESVTRLSENLIKQWKKTKTTSKHRRSFSKNFYLKMILRNVLSQFFIVKQKKIIKINGI